MKVYFSSDCSLSLEYKSVACFLDARGFNDFEADKNQMAGAQTRQRVSDIPQLFRVNRGLITSHEDFDVKYCYHI